jgi:hypothetical protein
MTAGIPVAGAVAAGAAIYHRLRMLGNWMIDDLGCFDI